MRVKLIKESSGFGYGSKVINWMVSDPENLNTLNRLKSGNICEIPKNIASGIHNIVNVETGEIVSTQCSLVGITREEVKNRYKTQKDTSHISRTMRTLKVSKPVRKPKITESQDEDF